MRNQPHPFWCTWISLVLLAIALFSLMLVASPIWTHVFFDWIAFFGERPSPLQDPSVVAYLSFVYGILGAVMLGWSILFLFVVYRPFRSGETWSWYALMVPLLVWFIVDSTHSVVSGFWLNAVFNSGFLTALGVPLIATFKNFHVPSPQANV